MTTDATPTTSPVRPLVSIGPGTEYRRSYLPVCELRGRGRPVIAEADPAGFPFVVEARPGRVGVFRSVGVARDRFHAERFARARCHHTGDTVAVVKCSDDHPGPRRVEFVSCLEGVERVVVEDVTT